MRGSMIAAGTHIRQVLMEDSGVAKMIAGRIFPYTTQTEVNSEEIVYSDIVAEYASTKDGQLSDRVSISLNCNTSSYDRGVALAEAVESALLKRPDIIINSVVVSYDAAALMYTHEFNIYIEYE